MNNITARIQKIEDALASALSRGEYEIVEENGARYLEPIFAGGEFVPPLGYPRLSLYEVARDLERLLP